MSQSQPLGVSVPLQAGPQTAEELSQPLHARLYAFQRPLLCRLDTLLDARLVHTFGAALLVLLQYRYRMHGLLLSELGGDLLGPAQAPAGTKRLSNLLRSPRWKAQEISTYLWQQAQQRVEELAQSGQDALVLWDESVIEKPESLHSEGLCPVRSSKAARLSRIKPGYYRPPSAPVFVPGLHWLALLVIGHSGPPQVAAMRWWSTRGGTPTTPQPPTPKSATPKSATPKSATPKSATPEWVSDGRTIATELLRQCAGAWGSLVWHIFDRGYAGAPWLEQLNTAKARFILRWPKQYKLRDEHALAGREVAAWQHTRGKRSWERRPLWDARHHCWRQCGVLAVPVYHERYRDADGALLPLWLVVARLGKDTKGRGSGREPWYLLTNEPVLTAEDAWRVVQAYARRWQIEMALRFNKWELCLDSPRLWTWERRLKLLLMVTLCYAFVLSLLREEWREWRAVVLRRYCHRTGKRSRETPTPLYRLRAALCHLLEEHPPALSFHFWQTPG